MFAPCKCRILNNPEQPKIIAEIEPIMNFNRSVSILDISVLYLSKINNGIKTSNRIINPTTKSSLAPGKWSNLKVTPIVNTKEPINPIEYVSFFTSAIYVP